MLTVVTGATHGVGKTVVSALLARRAAVGPPRRRLHVLKLVQTGRSTGTPGDADFVAALAAVPSSECARFESSADPAVAADLEQRPIPGDYLLDMMRMHAGLADVCVVEGTGGLLTPLSGTTTIADLAARTGARLVVVTDTRVGALNATLCTLAVARHQLLHLGGVVINRWPLAPDPNASALLERLERTATVLGCIPEIPGLDTARPETAATAEAVAHAWSDAGAV